MDLQELRKKIDEIDDGLVRLFQERMDLSAEIARYKKENNLPVHDPAREREKLYDLSFKTNPGRESYITALYYLLFELSRADQERILNQTCELTEKIQKSIKETEWMFPSRTVIACQGTEGSYSQQAAEKLFDLPSIMYCNTFESVFSAIDHGLCQYGLLPLENSTAGSINQVYDLMMRYPYSIVRSVRLKIDHSLLVKKGVKITDIKEIFSHEQAIAQCAGYLKSLNCKVTACENTAIAAKMVAESGRTDVAALSSAKCADLYDLHRIADSVQDRGSNFTRFICVTKSLAIYPGADKTSLMMTIPHRPGSLYHVLSRFYIHGINLIKLESRPIPDSDFEFMFYFDIETPVYSPALLQTIRELSELSDRFYYLGSYSEVV